MKKRYIDDTTILKRSGEVAYIEYIKLNEFPWLINAFSTREGGVSTDQYAKMNLNFNVGDDPEIVRENYRIFGEAIGVRTEQMVLSAQTHTSNVIRVDSSKCGMGILLDRDYENIDGLVTDEPGVCLVGSYADCVPLYFVDPVRKCIGLSHSGWRGTVAKIGRNTIELMNKEFGTDPADLVCCIGPSICSDCYEVSYDVIDEFKKNYRQDQVERMCQKVPMKPDKYLLDLAMANRLLFEESGVKPSNIVMPDLCTNCNKDLFHSHRGTGGKRGGNCAFLMII
ncbi:MAG: peptidoglycan editing factor PgeF [Lachnospiraceae bacterium]|nr:peptidoglycan editing factor PgeF [Lachnospiraceae bacterium]